MSTTQNNFWRNVIGGVLILVGAVLLLENLEIVNFNLPPYVFSWQMILITIGLIITINSTDKTGGLIVMGVGIIFLLPRIFNYAFTVWQLWPLVIIFVGIAMIVNRRKLTRKFVHIKIDDDENTKTKVEDGRLSEVAIFGGGNKTIVTDNFRGGEITAIFGGSEIDLLDSKLAEGENILEITAIFGGTTLIIPREWRVEINALPIFGGFSDARRKTAPVIETNDGRKLIIKGTFIFGGGEIKSA